MLSVRGYCTETKVHPTEKIQVRFQFTCACEREHRKIGTTPSMGSVQLEAVAFDELCSAQADGSESEIGAGICGLLDLVSMDIPALPGVAK